MPATGYNVSEICHFIKGELVQEGSANPLILDILIDSRRLIAPDHCLFFAIQGKRNDGHNYIDELYRKGIRNFVISILPVNMKEYQDASFILVNNTLRALQNLAAAHRKHFAIPVIGITGSNGKTIVKEWLFQLMHQDKKIIRSPKSYNSQIGVPLSVWQMEDTYDLAIFEAGISEPDEMDKLQAIIQPTIGLFTNIGAAHEKNFISTAQKVGEKLKLFTKVETLIYCPDHSEIQQIIIRSELLQSIKAFTWSRKQSASLQITGTVKMSLHQTKISGIYHEHEVSVIIPFIDEASVENAIHCWAAMLQMGYPNHIISERMAGLQPIAMRLELKEGINHCQVINDSYNSDINSLSIAIDFLEQQTHQKKKTVILSDILQSSKNDEELYGEIAGILEKKKVDRLIGIGPAISRYKDKFPGEKYFFPGTEDFLNRFSFSSFNNESILLKGARMFEFELISRALQQKSHETVMEINLNALVNNLNLYRSRLKPITKIMAMVKAFSYGSGSYEIANTLQFHRIDYLAVAYADEGVELRKAGIIVPILVMNPEEESFDSMITHQLEPEIYSFHILEKLENAIGKNIIPLNKPVKVHIKLDTGMHRLGFEEKDLDELIERLKKNKLIYVESVFSHLAASDMPEHDGFTRQQIERFRIMGEKVREAAGHPVMMHILNSAGIIRFPEAQFQMVRLGISLYGVSNVPEEQKKLENVSTMRSVISQVKHIPAGESVGYNRNGLSENDRKIAIVPVGYADGLHRNLGNGQGHLMVHDQLVPITGDVCMDMCMIDVTGLEVKEEDEVIIFGKNRPIPELAKEMQTIPYEVLSGISRRVKRIYYHE
ncbi:MAG: bifunctional UDP-N-acetylmuramoyl-tripeptide:D-alanyl-D-alanine ligase/alanine racemase [Bacteroidetes bacterium]|nr:bifunctional UDP-N-acetylmuramoyl-tripeptide:D-alanyl-D-alanine ligase/alanine racemase [Bacteroidota bacterium]